MEPAFLNSTDPFTLFQSWYTEAQTKHHDAEAMTLSTAEPDGRPSSRVVLLKSFDPEGFVFYTNLQSRKGRQMHANPWVALCFYWNSIGRQVRIEGKTVRVTDAEADAYFASRPRDSQLGAWASLQSETLPGRADLEKRFEQYAEKFKDQTVPRPTYWSGTRVIPVQIEFWQARESRLHDRLIFSRPDNNAAWQRQRLYP